MHTPSHSKLLSTLLNGAQTFPTDPFTVPAAVNEYLDRLISIPDGILGKNFPASNLPITVFLQQTFPPLSHELVHSNASTSFSPLAPNRDTSSIVTYPVPCKAFLLSLQSVLGQALLDGNQSILDLRYKDTRLPFWVITYWQALHTIHRLRDSWSCAVDWLKKYTGAQTGSATSFEAALQQLNELAVNADFQGPMVSGNLTTHELSRFLSDTKWMSGTLMDMMVAYLNLEHAQQLSVLRIMIIDTMFTINILAATSPVAYSERSLRGLMEVERKLSAAPPRQLYAPAFLEKQKHWIVIIINFEDKVIGYGDSLRHLSIPEPKNIVKKLQWWLEARFRGGFQYCGEILDHGRQTDLSSCGICAMNMIEHAVFNEPLWNSSRAAYERVKWFTRLVDVQFHQTRRDLESLPATSSCLLPDNEPAGWDDEIMVAEDDMESVDDHQTPSQEATLALHLEVESIYSEASTSATTKLVTPTNTAGPRSCRKRKTEDEQSDSDCYDTAVTDDERQGKRQHCGKSADLSQSSHAASDLANVATLSKSARSRRKILQEIKQGSFQHSEAARAKFQSTITTKDSHAEFSTMDPRKVRHSSCGKWLTMSSPYDTTRFSEHMTKCRGPLKQSKHQGAGMQTLDMFMKRTQSSHRSRTITAM
ncbi:hypothetical protein EV363DRAFT_1444144 [Boletus edulis]|nr:hypothetical protein EV363DRAFT_1444144 [Boletus edulis]